MEVATMPKEAVEQFCEMLFIKKVPDEVCLETFRWLKSGLYDGKARPVNQVVD